MKKLLTLGSILLLFVLGSTTFAQTDVTFSVDMRIWAAQDNFDRTTDSVWVAGSFNDWNIRGNQLTETDIDNVYEVTLSLADGEYYFKYTFTNSSTEQWEDNVDNRVATVAGTALAAGTYFFDDNRGTYSKVETDVEFNVDMTLPINQGNVVPGETNVYVAGNFTDWGTSAVLMEDPDGDSTYTATVTDTSGLMMLYKFIYSSSDASSGTWESFSEAGDDIAVNNDYNRVYGVVDGDTGTTKYWLNSDPNVSLADGNILFTVNMSVMEDAGIYDTVTDSLQIRAGFNGWDDSDPELTNMTQDFIDPTLYTINVPFDNAELNATQNFKYYVDLTDTSSIWTDGYERPFTQGGGNRDVDFLGQETQEVESVYFDDVLPSYVVQEGTTLEVTFSVDMTDAADAEKQAVPFDASEDILYWLPEQPSLVAAMGWEDSDTMKVLEMTDTDNDMVYTGTLTLSGEGWNGFMYRYYFQDVSEESKTYEPSGYSDFAYRVRYASMTGDNAFTSPFAMPTDSWLNQEDKSEQSETGPITSVRELDELTNSFKLSQNYPNPFNPTTLINFSIPQSDKVTLKVYNLLGQEVRTLVNEEMKAGSYEVKFNASSLASGIYFYTIHTGNFTATKKMMLLK